MGTYIGALVTFCASGGIPFGNHNCNTAFFVSGGTLFKRTVCVVGEYGNGKTVTVHLSDGLHNAVNHLNKFCGAVFRYGNGSVLCICPIRRNVNLNISRSTCVNSLFVHFNDFFTLLHELLGFFFHIADCFLSGKNLCKREECGLQNGICTFAQTDFCGNVDSVNRVKLNVVFSDVTLCFGIEFFRKFFFVPLAVDKEYAAGLNVLNHFVTFFNIGGVVTGNKVRLVDVVGALNCAVAETKVGNCYTACFLGVILEVCLNIFFGMVTDDFDGVLVCANGTVTAETPEFALDCAFGSRVGSLFFGE